ERCREDLEFFNQFIEKTVLATLEHVAGADFGHITYTDAVEELKKSGRSWEFPVEWGNDLQTEHERFLSEEIFKKPVIVTDYPKSIKAFYMRVNDTAKPCAPWTCSCRGSARSSAAASAKSVTTCCSSVCARPASMKNPTGGISICAATAPCPIPASAWAWSA